VHATAVTLVLEHVKVHSFIIIIIILQRRGNQYLPCTSLSTAAPLGSAALYFRNARNTATVKMCWYPECRLHKYASNCTSMRLFLGQVSKKNSVASTAGVSKHKKILNSIIHIIC